MKVHHRPTNLLSVVQSVIELHHFAAAGLTIEDVLEPSYWTHVASRLSPFTRITVDSEDGTWTARLIVRAVNRAEALVAVLEHVELEKGGLISDDPGFEVRWRGPAKRFGVVRLEDGEVIRDEFQTKDQAHQYLKNYLQRTAA